MSALDGFPVDVVVDPSIVVALIAGLAGLAGLYLQGHSAKRQRSTIGDQVTRIEVNTDGKLSALETKVTDLVSVVNMLRAHITQGTGAALSDEDEASATREAGPPMVEG